MSIAEHTSKKLSLLSFIAAVLVVCLHAPTTPEKGASWCIETFVSTHLSSIAVPFFFVVSGFFLGRRVDDDHWYKRAVANRIRTLFVSYAIWCMILALVRNMNSLIANIVNHQPLMRYINFSPVYVWGLNPFVNPPQPLWYLRALMLYVVISPVLLVLVRKRFLFIMSFVVFFSLSCCSSWLIGVYPGDLFVFTLAPINVLAFMTGLFLGRNPIALPRGYGLALLPGLGVMVYGTYLSYSGVCQISPLLWNIAVVTTLIGIWAICQPVELPKFLKAQAFPIYLLHGVLVTFVLMVRVLAPVFTLSLIGYLLSVLFMVMGSIGISMLLRKYSPKMAAILFGGR